MTPAKTIPKIVQLSRLLLLRFASLQMARPSASLAGLCHEVGEPCQPQLGLDDQADRVKES
jgi:hypothetical protein